MAQRSVSIGRGHALQAGQFGQPRGGIAVLLEPRRISRPGELQGRGLAQAAFQVDQDLLAIRGHAGLVIASGLGERQARLEGLGRRPGLAESLQRQRPGQRLAVVHLIQGEQVGRFVARLGMKQLGGDFRQAFVIARGNRPIELVAGLGPVADFVQIAALARHLSQELLGLGLQALVDGDLAVGLIERVFVAAKDLAEPFQGLAVAMFFQDLLGPVQRLQDIAVGGGKVPRAGIVIRRLAGRRTGHGESALVVPEAGRPGPKGRDQDCGNSKQESSAVPIPASPSSVSRCVKFRAPPIIVGEDNPFRPKPSLTLQPSTMVADEQSSFKELLHILS